MARVSISIMPRGDLFPEIGPFEIGTLPLTDGHTMYWEQVGNPRGAPVLFLHGGPGAGAGAVHRRFFDPAFWRVVVFDQRGAGRSRPLGSLSFEYDAAPRRRVRPSRSHLGLDRWPPVWWLVGIDARACVCAGISGSTWRACAARSVSRPAAGGGLVPARPGNDLPRCAHAAFTGFLPKPERGDLLGNYLRRLTDPDPEAAHAGGTGVVDL